MTADRLEYGTRWTNTDGEISVARRNPTIDAETAVQLVGHLRAIQQRQGRTPDAHLVARHINDEDMPLDDWHAIPRPEASHA